MERSSGSYLRFVLRLDDERSERRERSLVHAMEVSKAVDHGAVRRERRFAMRLGILVAYPRGILVEDVVSGDESSLAFRVYPSTVYSPPSLYSPPFLDNS